SLVVGKRATPAPTARGAANANVGSVEEAVPCHLSLTHLGPGRRKDNGHLLEVELSVLLCRDYENVCFEIRDCVKKIPGKKATLVIYRVQEMSLQSVYKMKSKLQPSVLTTALGTSWPAAYKGGLRIDFRGRPEIFDSIDD
ncbi:hypothetical protein HPB47_017421, partial [Ixodes persulcatus]